VTRIYVGADVNCARYGSLERRAATEVRGVESASDRTDRTHNNRSTPNVHKEPRLQVLYEMTALHQDTRTHKRRTEGGACHVPVIRECRRERVRYAAFHGYPAGRSCCGAKYGTWAGKVLVRMKGGGLVCVTWDSGPPVLVTAALQASRKGGDSLRIFCCSFVELGKPILLI